MISTPSSRGRHQSTTPVDVYAVFEPFYHAVRKERVMGGPHQVFLFDVDNTLLDNDAVKADLERALEASLGREDAGRFWDLYDQVRNALGLVSFPETIERFLPAHCADPLARRGQPGPSSRSTSPPTCAPELWSC